LDVIQHLYNRAHELIPGCLVEDDSSWIEWQRVHDFHDDHPYGNNFEWKHMLERLEASIQTKKPKPLVLGEAIAADTWPSGTPERNDIGLGVGSIHHHLSNANSEAAVNRINDLFAAGDGIRYEPPFDSSSNAFATRKFQIERFRYQMPRQGYVVSVIRDFPFASMGLIDFDGRPKIDVESMQWHRESMLCLETPYDARSYFEDSFINAKWHFVEPKTNHHRHVVSVSDQREVKTFEIDPNESPVHTIESSLRVDAVGESSVGMMRLESSWAQSTVPFYTPIQGRTYGSSNSWLIWAIKKIQPLPESYAFYRHASASDLQLGPVLHNAFQNPWSPEVPTRHSMVVSRKLDTELLEWLKRGGKVLCLPDGSTGSFPIRNHWFLRGGPLVNQSVLGEPEFASMIQSLQSFELGGPVMYAPDYLDEVTPWVLVWDNHDIPEHRLHALAWTSQFLKGRLSVSTLEFNPNRGAACTAFLDRMIRDLIKETRVRSMSEETIGRMEYDLKNPEQELERSGWMFQRDPKNQGMELGWHLPGTSRATWSKIEISQPWDVQGHQDLDGWAWYYRDMELDTDIRYLTFTGVDDYFEVYVNGIQIGSGGDRNKKVTAFDQKVVLALPESRSAKVSIAIRVEDWQGAGGVFRPVYLSRTLPPTKSAILKRPVRSTTASK
jgi:hypothetical protein